MNETNFPESVSVQEAAQILNISQSKVTRLIEEQALIGVKIDGELRIPEVLLKDGHIIPALRGTLMLLSDLGLSNKESIDWLLTENEVLNETPLESLGKGHKAPVRRAAQLLAEIL